LSEKARKAFGGRRALQNKQRDAEKMRKAHGLCLCGDHFEFFDSPAERDAWQKDAKPIVCEQCSREKLVVVTFCNGKGQPIHVDDAADALISDFIKRR
jgi:hypothetical protein